MLKGYLLSFGFTEEDYFTFINYNRLREYKRETLYRKTKEINECLLSYGYTNYDIIYMARINPLLYSLSVEKITSRINDFIRYGYKMKEVIRATKQIPRLFNYNIVWMRTND